MNRKLIHDTEELVFVGLALLVIAAGLLVMSHDNNITGGGVLDIAESYGSGESLVGSYMLSIAEFVPIDARIVVEFNEESYERALSGYVITDLVTENYNGVEMFGYNNTEIVVGLSEFNITLPEKEGKYELIVSLVWQNETLESINETVVVKEEEKFELIEESEDAEKEGYWIEIRGEEYSDRRALLSSNNGDKVKLRFSGDNLFVRTKVREDIGAISVSVDGRERKFRFIGDEREEEVLVAYDLFDGEHLVEIEVLENEYVVLDSFLVKDKVEVDDVSEMLGFEAEDVKVAENKIDEVTAIGEKEETTVSIEGEGIHILPSGDNDSIDLTQNIMLVCNSSDELGLANISLWHNMNGTWRENGTSAVEGVVNTSNFTIIPAEQFGANVIKDTRVTWACVVDNVAGVRNFSENYTFSGWDLGSYYNTTLNVTNISLMPNSTGQFNTTFGTYESRVFDSGFNAVWKNVSWDEAMPYSESIPAEGNDIFNMSGLVGFWRLEEDGEDDSGRGFNGTVKVDELSIKDGELSTKKRYLAAAESTNTGKIYVFGGVTDTLAYPDIIEEYDPETDTISPMSALMPGGRSEFSCAENSNTSKIYCFGGVNITPALYVYNQTFEYNPETDSVTVLNTELPNASANHACAEDSSTNFIYCFGGTNVTYTYKHILEYNPYTDLITKKTATMPVAWSQGACAENPMTHKIYCFGGSGSAAIYEYDPQGDSLTTKSAVLPTTTSLFSCDADPLTGHIYCFGGYSSSNLNTIVEYNPYTDTIRKVNETLPVDRRGLACQRDNSTRRIYCFGGLEGGSVNQTVEYNPAVKVAGKKGEGMVFDGFSDHIDLGRNLTILNGVNGTTLMAWIKPARLNTQVSQDVISISINNSGVPTITSRAVMLVNVSGKVRIAGKSSDTEVVVTAWTDDITLNENNWHHVVGIMDYENDAINIYVDGVKRPVTQSGVFTEPGTSDANSTCAAIGASDEGSTTFFNGTIDEVMVWNRTLREEEIVKLYKSGALRLNLSLRSCDDGSCLGENFTVQCTNASFCDISSLSNNQYVQYKVNIESESVNFTPELLSESVVIGFDEGPDIGEPVATNVYPGDGNYSVDLTQSVGFMCNATDNIGLTNISLWHNINGTWMENGTTIIGGLINNSMFNVIVSEQIGVNKFKDSVYKYACVVDDAAGHRTFGQNYSFGSWELGVFNNSLLNASGLYLTDNDSMQELPADGINDGFINMTGNVLLMHLDNDSNYGEDDTHVYDFSGITNGTVNNAAFISGGWLNGAYHFDAINDNITFTTLNQDQITISAWVKSDSELTEAEQGIVGMPGYRFYLAGDVIVGADYTLRFRSRRSFISAIWSTDADTISMDGTWYHVAVVYNSSSISNVPKLYINGVEMAVSEVAAPSGTQDLNAGLGLIGTGYGEYPLNGTIDEVAAWNRTLSASEILNIYNRQKGKYIDRASYESRVFDSGLNTQWKNMTWDEAVNYTLGTNITLYGRSCDDSSCLGEVYNVTCDNSSYCNLSVLPINTYFQYKIEFKTNNTNYTPELLSESVMIGYEQVLGTNLNCGDTINADTVLTGDVLNSSGGEMCGTSSAIIMGANNIVLDCAGHGMTGNWTNASSGQNYGINMGGYSNVTIKNCDIRNFSRGISGGVNSSIFGNNITESGIGLYGGSAGINVSHNRFKDLGLGVFVSGSGHHVINNSFVNILADRYGGPSYAVDAGNSDNAVIMNFTIINSSRGIRIGNNASLIGIDMSQVDVADQVLAIGGSNVILDGVNITRPINYTTGIIIQNNIGAVPPNNVTINNTIIGNFTDYGVYMGLGNNSLVNSIIIGNNTGYGVLATENNTLKGNNISHVYTGISINSGKDSTVSENRVENVSIGIFDSAERTMICANNISNVSGTGKSWAIDALNSNNATICRNNTISNAYGAIRFGDNVNVSDWDFSDYGVTSTMIGAGGRHSNFRNLTIKGKGAVYGIEFGNNVGRSSENNTLTDINITNTTYAIYFGNAYNNTIHSINVINNTYSIFISGADNIIKDSNFSAIRVGASSNNSLYRVNVTDYSDFYSSSYTYTDNSSFGGEFRMSVYAVVNFTSQSKIDNISYLVGAATSHAIEIDGYVNITNKNIQFGPTANNTVIRYFPVQVLNYTGGGVQADLNVTRAGVNVFSTVTNASGFIRVPVMFNATQYTQELNITASFNPYVNKTFNITTDTIITLQAEAPPNITNVYPNSTGGESYDMGEMINVSIAEPNNQTFNITYTNESAATVRWHVDGVADGLYENLTWFNWTGNYTQNGSYIILVNVSNDAGADWQYWNLTVNNTNRVPVVNFALLNSTNGTNYTTENLTIYTNVSDADGDSVKNITNWYVNGTSITVLNMPFEAGYNKSRDYSSNENNGTENGGVLWNLSAGYDGSGAYQFDGLDDYISINHEGTLNLTGNYSLELWLYPKLVNNNFHWVLSKDNDNAGINYLFGISSNNRWRFITRALNSDLYSAQIVEANRWYHIVAVDDGDSLKLYVNGTLDNSTATSGAIITNLQDVLLGARYSGGLTQYFNGTIDEVRLYNRSLTPEQIFALYQNRTDLIVSNETNAGEEWYAKVTPNDGYEDGLSVLSNNVTIRALPIPNITTIYPNSTGGESYDNGEMINVSIFEPSNQTFNITYTNESAATVRWHVDGVADGLYENLTWFNWTGNYSQAGSYVIMVNVSSAGEEDVQQWNLTVNDEVCMAVQDGMNITEPVTLCPGEYQIDEGIIIGSSDVAVSCNGTKLLGSGSIGFLIRKPGLDNITIENCNLSHHKYAIFTNMTNTSIGNLTNVNFYGNIIKNSTNGIYLSQGSAQNMSVVNNSVEECTGGQSVVTIGIYQQSTGSNILIKGNNVTNCRWGLNINGQDYPSGLMNITENRVESCSRGILVGSTSLSGENIPKHVYNNSLINNSYAGIWCYDVEGVVYRHNKLNYIYNNTFERNNIGVHISGNSSAEIFNNSFKNGTIGIRIFDTKDSVIYNNTLNANKHDLEIDLTGTFITDALNNYFINQSFNNATIFDSNNKINYTGVINFMQNASLSTLFGFSINRTFVNSTGATLFGAKINTSATLYLGELSLSSAYAQVDFNDDGVFDYCNHTQCSSVSYNGGVATFNVSSFTTYIVTGDQEGPTYNFSSCMDITSPGEYNLIDDIINATSDLCINISADNVSLDCNGKLVHGNGSVSFGIGINKSYDNITIKNCRIENWRNAGLHHAYGSNITVMNTSANSNKDDGIFVSGGSIRFISVSGNNNTDYGIRFFFSGGKVIINSSFNNNGLTGMNLGGGLIGSDYNNISGVTASGNGNYGLYLSQSDSNLINNCTFSQNTRGIFISESQNNIINDSYLFNNTRGVYLYVGSGGSGASDGNRIYNNFFNNTNNFVIEEYGGAKVNNWSTQEYAATNIIGGSTLGGNYWALISGGGFSETCGDGDGDGICDDAYTLTAGNIDYLPLSKGNSSTLNSCINITMPGEYYLISPIINSGISRCINIIADNVTFDCLGNAIDGDDNAEQGIFINRSSDTVSNITVKNCIVTDWNTYAIYTYKSGWNTFENLTLDSNPDTAMYLREAQGSIVNDSVITNSGVNGIAWVKDPGTLVNLFINSSGNAGISIGSTDVTDASYVNVTNIIVYHSVYGISMAGDYHTVHNCSLKYNDYGILISAPTASATGESNYITVKDTEIANNTRGILLQATGATRAVRNNSVYNNKFNNTVSNLAVSGDGITQANNISKYLQSGTNIINGSYIGGNYWANPAGTGFSETCVNIDGDGICDSAYTLAAGNVDNLPLTLSDTILPNITSIYPNSTGGESYDPGEIINVSIVEDNNQTFNITYTNLTAVSITWLVDGFEYGGYRNLTQFNWTGNYSQAVSYLILVNVSNITYSKLQYWNLTVNNTNRVPYFEAYTPSSLTPVLLEPYNQSFNTTVIEPDEEDVTYEWYVNGTFVSNLTQYNFTGNYSSSSVYNITLVVNDTWLASNRTTWILTVSETNREPYFEAYTPDIPSLNIAEDENSSFNVTAIDPDLNPLAYYWYVNGTQVSTLMQYNFTGNYTAWGGYNITLVVNDTLLGSNSTTWILNVNNTNRNPLIETLTPITLTPNIAEPENMSFNATVAERDNETLSYYWFVNGSQVSTLMQYNFTGNYTASGGYNITLVVNDTLLGSNSTMWILTVNDTEVTVLNISNQINYTTDNMTYTFYANFTKDGSCSLWGNWSGSWSKNETRSVINNTQFSFTSITFNGTVTYLWGINCSDNLGNMVWGQNFTFIVNEILAHGFCYAAATCASGYTPVFTISNYSDAHAALNISDSDAYDYKICCNNTIVKNNSCASVNNATVVVLSNYTNAHVEQSDQGNYAYPACIATETPYQCSYRSNCTAEENCVVTISNVTDAHIADCDTDPYAIKVCCGNASAEAPVFNLTNPVSNVAFSFNTTNSSINLTQHFYHPNGLSLGYAANDTDNVSVTIYNSSGSVIISASTGFIGTDNISFTAFDTNGKTNASNVVIITVTQVNESPVFNASNVMPNVSFTANTTDTSLILSLYFYHPNGYDLNYTVNGTDNLDVQINNDTGQATITSYTGFTGTDVITFTAFDVNGRTNASNEITITVNAAIFCGDGTCNGGETCTNCPADCGACPVTPASGGGGGGGGGPTPAQAAQQTPAIAPSVAAPSVGASGGGSFCINRTRLVYEEPKIKRIVKFTGKVQLPEGYSVIGQPFRVDCSQGYGEASINVPDYYDDVHVLRCYDSSCERLESKNITETVKVYEVTETICAGKVVKEISRKDVSIMRDRMLNAEQIMVKVPETLSEEGKIESDELKISFSKEITFKASQDAIEQPNNPSLKIITPIIITFEESPGEVDARLEMPYAANPEIEKGSESIYIKEGEDWVYLGGEIDDENKVVILDVEKINRYMHDGMIELAVIGIICVDCGEARLERVWMPVQGSRDSLIMVHGLGSSPEAFVEIISDIKTTRQPWQAWTFGYPTADTVDKNAEVFADYIQSNVNEFDKLYIAAHSLGGLITQKALWLAHNDRIRYSFIDKVRKVVLVGVPTEGSPSAEVYDQLFRYLVNTKKESTIFKFNTKSIDDLIQGIDVPRVPGVEYYVLAGTKPYTIGGLISSQEVFGFDDKNDGIVGVKSAQNVGGEYVNDSCKNYWELDVTHTDLIDNAEARKVLERIVAEQILGVESELGYTNYLSIKAEECNEEDLFVVVGIKTSKEEAYDPTGCKCGNGVCGEGEDEINCPKDCLRFEEEEVLKQSIPIILLLAVILYVMNQEMNFYRKVFGKEARKLLSLLLYALVGFMVIAYIFAMGLSAYNINVALAFSLVMLLYVSARVFRRETLGILGRAMHNMNKLSASLSIVIVNTLLLGVIFVSYIMDKSIVFGIGNAIIICNILYLVEQPIKNTGYLFETVRKTHDKINFFVNRLFKRKYMIVKSQADLERLESLIKEMMEKGYGKWGILSEMQKQGWPNDIVRAYYYQAIKERSIKFSKKEDASIKAIDFIKKSVIKGYNAEQIKDALIKKGWNKEIIDRYYDLVSKKFKGK